MKKKILVVSLILVAMGLWYAYRIYSRIYSGNVKETTSVYIPTGTDFEGLLPLLRPYLEDVDDFVWVAEKKNYNNKVRAGKFRIEEGMSNDELVNHLRGGKQETVTLTFNNQDRLDRLAGRVASQIEADSLSLLETLTDPGFLESHGFDQSNALSMYVPNSYDFYWNTSAEGFRDRMLNEYKRFWNEDRVRKAEQLNLTPLQVTTLASIVQKETSVVSERKRVAGLYLNRLRDFWPLQADPTIIYALKQKNGQDKEYKRVLNEDLTIDSPYNTYTNFGLPPGPIGMPDISSIDAVLNPEDHDFYYMCASVDDPGKHKFAKTLAQHNANARAYQQWVSQQGIKR
jgi:UPF0755 protein